MKAFPSGFRSVCLPGMVFMLMLPALSCQAKENSTAEKLKIATTATGQQRYTAIDDLGENPVAASTVVPELIKMLGDKDVQVRWRAARALGDYGALAQEAVPELRKLVSSSDTVVRIHAIVALGRIGDKSPATVDALVDAASGSDPVVQREAIGALRAIHPGPEKVAKALSHALSSNDPAIMERALEAIVDQGANAVPLLIDAIKQPNTTLLACAAIEQIGPDAAGAVPALTELLAETVHSQVQIQALLALASIGPAARPATDRVVLLMDASQDATVPVAAAYCLGSIGATDADADLNKALKSNNAFLRMVASWSLAKIHPDDTELLSQAVRELTRGLASSDAAMRTAAANGLEKLHAPPEMVAPALITVADDPDPAVRANVIRALASLGPKVIPKACLALEKPKLRYLALRVLAHMGPDAKGAVGCLVKAMNGADPEFLARIQATLAAIGPAAAPATDALVKSLGSSDQGVVQSAMIALRQIGPGAAAAKAPLLKLLQKKDSYEAMAAAWALSQIAPKDADVMAQAVPELMLGLESTDADVRMQSVVALSAMGPAATSALPTLRQMATDDGSPIVRAAADGAVGHITGQP